MNNLIKKGIWIVAIATLLLTDASTCRAASPDSLVYSFHFRLGDDLLMKDYRANRRNLEALAQWMTPENIARISTIRILGTASPEGVPALNDRLSLRRAQAVRRYILGRWKTIDGATVVAGGKTDYLTAWTLAITNDPRTPRRDRVLQILNSTASIQTKWANIQLLSGGAAPYIRQTVFPQLRNAVACVITLKAESQAPSGAKKEDKPQEQDNPKSEANQKFENENTNKTHDEVETPAEEQALAGSYESAAGDEETEGRTFQPLFALKTNLLFDAASLLNAEVEVPLGKRWSVAAEWIFPWWLWEDKQHCLQVLSGNVEGKYWLGNREVMPNGRRRHVLTGWHAGVYAGGGYYDLEWNKEGYQGEFFIAAGISGGYAHTLNKSGSLRMEYSLGIGYMQTHYRKYDAELGKDGNWHLYRNSNGRYTWIGPTRLRVSLVWMIQGKQKGGTAR